MRSDLQKLMSLLDGDVDDLQLAHILMEAFVLSTRYARCELGYMLRPQMSTCLRSYFCLTRCCIPVPIIQC